MNIVVIGSGYVGLVTGTCLAEIGHHVQCVDVDENKINLLQQGNIPIYEPGLDLLVKKNLSTGHLNFSTNLTTVLDQQAVIFIAVGTPSDENGAADLSYVFKVAHEIGKGLKYRSLIVNKSTVPVGTAEQVKEIIEAELMGRNVDVEFSVASNPEFLKEGKAIQDFMDPDRIVIGVESIDAEKTLRDIYHPLLQRDEKLIVMPVREAEMTKYVANAMLATRISFMNEMATICDELNINIENIRQGIGSDARIGPHFLLAGCGYGGSCFPKDVKALIQTADTAGVDAKVLKAVDERNNLQKKMLFKKLIKAFDGNLTDKSIAVWGLAFKPETDDMRESSSSVFLDEALRHGARIKAYDPVAMSAAKKIFPSAWFDQNQLALVDSAEKAVQDADALVVITEWQEFKDFDLTKLSCSMAGKVIIDGRNIFNPEQLKKLEWVYVGTGQ